MVIDASAIVAVLAMEPDSMSLVDRMSNARQRVTHGVSVWESVAAMTRLKRGDAQGALTDVREFLNLIEAPVANIGTAETLAAMEAFRLYGKPSGHLAQLNLGDCFSYGVAQAHGMPLLYKGKDFIYTPLG